MGNTLDKPVYRSSSSYPSLLFKALFLEEATGEKKYILYSLRDQDTQGYPSLYRLYMEMGDIYELDFANKYFENWDHWQALCQCDWFIPHIVRWRTELELRLRSRALKAVIEEAEAGTSNSYQANKFLLQGGWRTKQGEDNTPKSKRGRPSKTEILKAAEDLAKDAQLAADDAKRLGLN